jgi:hypothetical protein
VNVRGLEERPGEDWEGAWPQEVKFLLLPVTEPLSRVVLWSLRITAKFFQCTKFMFTLNQGICCPQAFCLKWTVGKCRKASTCYKSKGRWEAHGRVRAKGGQFTRNCEDLARWLWKRVCAEGLVHPTRCQRGKRIHVIIVAFF